MIGHLGRALAFAVAFGWGGVPAYPSPAAQRQSGTEVTSPGRLGSQLEADHSRTRAVIEEVLARREFAELHADPHAFWRWLRERILYFLGRVAATLSGLPGWVFWVIVAWLVLALAAILAHLIYTLWALLGGRSRASRAGSGGRRHQGELLGIQDLDFDSVYAEARRLLTAGDWLAATRYLYVAAILWLDHEGRIAFRPSKTNRDYIGELQAQAQLQGLFRRLTDGFESVVYGGQSATTSTSHDMAGTVEGLLHAPAGAIAS